MYWTRLRQRQGHREQCEVKEQARAKAGYWGVPRQEGGKSGAERGPTNGNQKVSKRMN